MMIQVPRHVPTSWHEADVNLIDYNTGILLSLRHYNTTFSLRLTGEQLQRLLQFADVVVRRDG